jgi:hypothetical protein
VVSEKGEKVLKYSRLGTWPPHSDFFGGSPIGVAYYLQRWFRYGLQEWIGVIFEFPDRLGEAVEPEGFIGHFGSFTPSGNPAARRKS